MTTMTKKKKSKLLTSPILYVFECMSACTYKCVHFNSDYLNICTQHSRYEHNAV